MEKAIARNGSVMIGTQPGYMDREFDYAEINKNGATFYSAKIAFFVPKDRIICIDYDYEEDEQ